MSGSKIQLVSIGFEDLYLTVDPQITFFKMVYKRYTNFSQEPVIQYFNSDPDFGKRVTSTIAKTSDLISNIYLFVQIPSIPIITNNSNIVIEKFKWVKRLGYALINYIELEINGQIIDKLYSDFMNIWSLLTTGQDRISEDILIGNIPELYEFSNGKKLFNLYIPINFFFNRNKGLALPVIALNMCDIKIHVEFNKLQDVLISSPTHFIKIKEFCTHFKENEILTQNISGTDVSIIYNNFDYEKNRLYYTKYNSSIKNYNATSNINKTQYKIKNKQGYYVIPDSEEFIYTVNYPNVSLNSAYLIINFIYLDNLERKKFLISNHEYLINQIQFSGERTVHNINSKVNLSFTNNCKELIWIAQMSKIKDGFIKEKFNYTSNINYSGNNIIEKSSIFFNGQNRSKEGDKYIYNYLENYLYHTSYIQEGINIYSFSIDPENYQPHGSCNFSKIDDLTLDLSFNSSVSYDNPLILKIFCYNYNILRITKGLGGLLFN